MKILGLLVLVGIGGIGFLAWKIIRARAEFPPYDILIEEDEQVMMGDDWDGLG
jgi:hypothetical protein